MRWLAVAVLVAVAAATMSSVISAQSKKAKKQEQNESYTRPKPTRPIHPEIPSANRYRQDKVFLNRPIRSTAVPMTRRNTRS